MGTQHVDKGQAPLPGLFDGLQAPTGGIAAVGPTNIGELLKPHLDEALDRLMSARRWYYRDPPSGHSSQRPYKADQPQVASLSLAESVNRLGRGLESLGVDSMKGISEWRPTFNLSEQERLLVDSSLKIFSLVSDSCTIGNLDIERVATGRCQDLIEVLETLNRRPRSPR
jgi:hypothetical protein